MENSLDTRVRWNIATGNTSAVVVVILPDLPTAAVENMLIEGNAIFDNNLPNRSRPAIRRHRVDPHRNRDLERRRRQRRDPAAT